MQHRVTNGCKYFHFAGLISIPVVISIIGLMVFQSALIWWGVIVLTDVFVIYLTIKKIKNSAFELLFREDEISLNYRYRPEKHVFSYDSLTEVHKSDGFSFQ